MQAVYTMFESLIKAGSASMALGISDEELCDSVIRHEDGDAAAELTHRYYRKIYSYICRLSENPAAAEDITQQTFLQCWARIGQFRLNGSFAPWIYRIAHNAFIDWHRKERHHQQRDAEWWNKLTDLAPIPGDGDGDHDLSIAVFRAVSNLEEKYRYVIHLHYFQDFDVPEIASILGMTRAGVRYRLRKAFTRIKAALAELGIDPQQL